MAKSSEKNGKTLKKGKLERQKRKLFYNIHYKKRGQKKAPRFRLPRQAKAGKKERTSKKNARLSLPKESESRKEKLTKKKK